MAATIILPGIGGSGDAHWQTAWARSSPEMVRFEPSSWDAPVLDDWMLALDRAVRKAPEPPLLVAHSLACLLVAHWSARSPTLAVRGAILVAVPDPDGPDFPAEAAATFCDVPSRPLLFPSLVIASENDPYGSLACSRACAAAWDSGLVVAGSLGHINGESALGEWPLGRMLYEAFLAGTARAP
jgi:uncharacterized protein